MNFLTEIQDINKDFTDIRVSNATEAFQLQEIGNKTSKLNGLGKKHRVEYKRYIELITDDGLVSTRKKEVLDRYQHKFYVDVFNMNDPASPRLCLVTDDQLRRQRLSTVSRIL